MNIQSKTGYLASLVLVLPLLHGQAVAAEGVQERRLSGSSVARQPVEHQRRASVDDRLREGAVEPALDKQNGPAQNKLSGGTRRATDDAEENSDDDCD